jgi:hypothetical protein
MEVGGQRLDGSFADTMKRALTDVVALHDVLVGPAIDVRLTLHQIVQPAAPPVLPPGVGGAPGERKRSSALEIVSAAPYVKEMPGRTRAAVDTSCAGRRFGSCQLSAPRLAKRGPRTAYTFRVVTQSNASMPSTPELGQRYRLVRHVVDDGVTSTWEGFDPRLERPVLLRVLSPAVRQDEEARIRLRQAARAPRLSSSSGDEGPRILDGGEDPIFGPFLVAEVTESFEATHLLPVIPPAVAEPPQAAAPVPDEHARARARPARPREVPVRDTRRGFGIIALAGVIVAGVAALVFLVRTFVWTTESEPAAAPTAISSQPTRPLSGAREGQPRVEPTVAPTLAAAARPTASRQATQGSAATPTAAPGAVSSVDTIRQHYALIDARRYAEGYTLMSANLRALNSPADYASWFANKVSIKPISIDLVSQDEARAVVRSTVETTDLVNGAQATTTVSEEFTLRRENGAWRIDRVSRV